MTLGIAAILCIAVFVVSAFVLRARMHRLGAVYEAENAALLAAELALLHGGTAPDIRALQRRASQAARHARVMRTNAILFRLLWPEEYDRAFYAAQRVIAQSGRLSILSAR